MKTKNKQSGLTLIEMLVVIGIIATVVALSLPALNAMSKSFDSTGAKGMISAALSTARTLAISKQQYVGVRFQTSYDPCDVLDEDQYMIFIIYQPQQSGITLTNMFKAIEGYKPIKLPVNMGVMEVGEPNFVNAEKFSVVFSPAGKLVIHQVQTRNHDGKPSGSIDSDDVVFNTEVKMTSSKPCGQFLQDENNEDENSRGNLKIYNRKEFDKYAPADRYDKYIKGLPALYINPYTGGIIE